MRKDKRTTELTPGRTLKHLEALDTVLSSGIEPFNPGGYRAWINYETKGNWVGYGESRAEAVEELAKSIKYKN